MTAPIEPPAPAASRPQMGQERAQFVALIVTALLGEYSLLIVPFIMTAMINGYHLNEATAGNLVSLQLIAMGIAGIAVSYLLARFPARRIVVFGCVLAIAANVICALGSGEALLASGRLLTGLGEGSLMAAGGALAAG